MDGSGAVVSSGVTSALFALVVDRVNDRLVWPVVGDDIRSSDFMAGAAGSIAITNLDSAIAIDNPDLPVLLHRFDVE